MTLKWRNHQKMSFIHIQSIVTQTASKIASKIADKESGMSGHTHFSGLVYDQKDFFQYDALIQPFGSFT